MSVTDPLLKEIKGCVRKFLNEAADGVFDDNANLLIFCNALEKTFYFGLLPQQNSFGFLVKECGPWNWLEKLGDTKHPAITFAFADCVEKARNNCTAQTNRGKFRLLVRLCLASKCLHVPLEYLLQIRRLNCVYSQNSVLGDEILSQILLSVLLQCGKIDFKLDVRSASFLDLTWRIPQFLRFEFVPCESLGLSVSFSGGKAIIVRVHPSSVAAENGQIEVGDVLDSLNNVHICSATRGSLASIFRDSKHQPVQVTVIKAIHTVTNEIFGPLVRLLKEVHLDPCVLKEKRLSQSNIGDKDKAQQQQTPRPGFNATYLGNVETGKYGDAKQIDKAGRFLLSPFRKHKDSSRQDHSDFSIKEERKKISFEIGEIGLKIVNCETNELLVKHSYMEISSCASITGLNHYFGYIAGDEVCSTSTNFICYLFYSKSEEDVTTILQSIGQGFHRTHFAV